jgi:hypothetical protein
MTDLSPAAEAVLNAVTFKRYDAPYYACLKSIDQIKSDVAAALRAAADQMGSYQSKKFLYSIADAMKLQEIADELEQFNA